MVSGIVYLFVALLDNTADDQRDDAYKYFIMALKRNSNYAPAFTSLGIYYADFISPPDPTRASKCFQKAFELDPREAYAARRLAEGFAEEREWDLVEVVARRTIEGEGGLDAGMKDGDAVVAGRYLPTNAWAWKAVGVVELVSLQFLFFRCFTQRRQCRRAGTTHPQSKHSRLLSEPTPTNSCYGYALGKLTAKLAVILPP